MRKVKLAVFDMEGTIFRNTFQGQEFPSIWKVLCKICGPQAEEEDAANTRKYYSGGYPGYSSWVIDTLQILQKHGFTRRRFEKIVTAIEYFPGVNDTFSALKAKGIQIAVISGGLKALADRVAIEHGVEHCFAAAELYWNANGTIGHWNVLPTDFRHKRSVLEMLCRDLGIKRNECAFIGNGRNDADVAEYAALSIGFNPHQKLRESASILIEQLPGKENLAAILSPLLKHPFFSQADFSSGNLWNTKAKERFTQRPKLTSSTTGTLTKSGQRDYLHAFLVKEGLTANSADSYCSYLNNLCRNIAAISWNGASLTNAFSILTESALSNRIEDEFLLALAKPLAGPNGRTNDMSSAARQFYRFIKGRR